MREDAFRAFLIAEDYTGNSVASRLSRCRHVEKRLAIDLDVAALDAPSIEVYRERLVRDGLAGPILASLLNAIRTYARFRDGTFASGTVTPPSAPPARDPALAAESVPALMRRYAAILGELRHRGVLRSADAPIGDYGEALFAGAFGWTLAGNSTRGYDAVDAAGVRYQIKARRLTALSPSRQLGALRQLPDGHFDQLAALLFGENMAVLRAAIIPHAVVRDLATRVEHTNSWRMMLSDRVWSIAGVIDATAALRAWSLALENDS